MKKLTVNYQNILIATLTVLILSSGYFLSASVTTFQGTAKPFITASLKYGFNDAYRGIVQWTALPGQIVKGPIYDKKGEVVRPGDVLIQLDTEYRASMVKTKQDAIKIAEANLNWTKANFERYKTLSKTRAASLQKFQEAQNNYLSDVASLDSARAELISAKALFALTTYRTQFDAIIDKVLTPCGLLAGEPFAITISQINPIAIEIEIPRDVAKRIDINTPVKIYPCNSDKPVGVIAGYYVYTDTGMRFFTDNYLLPPKNNKLPIVKIVRTIIRMDLYNKEPLKLSVNENAIKKDKKGTFVWYAKNAKDLQPGVGVNPVLELEKVYVETGNLIHKVDNHWVYIYLKNAGKLKQYDLVVEDAPKNAKNGDKVFWYKESLLFMPGDPVRVEIGK